MNVWRYVYWLCTAACFLTVPANVVLGRPGWALYGFVLGMWNLWAALKAGGNYEH